MSKYKRNQGLSIIDRQQWLIDQARRPRQRNSQEDFKESKDFEAVYEWGQNCSRHQQLSTQTTSIVPSTVGVAPPTLHAMTKAAKRPRRVSRGTLYQAKEAGWGATVTHPTAVPHAPLQAWRKEDDAVKRLKTNVSPPEPSAKGVPTTHYPVQQDA